MDRHARIHVAGHRGLVGSAIVRRLRADGFHNLLLRTSAELDLTDQGRVAEFYAAERPQFVFLAAAKVGGIHANSVQPAEFIHANLAIQTNVIHSAWKQKVARLLFLGSSCIYPRDCPQPIQERSLLTGPLEPTNRAYAIAKIAGIEMCRAYNVQYGTQFLATMPTNLYGPGDNFEGDGGHVIPALMKRFHEAAKHGVPEVVVWGTGNPRREFLHSDDLADALMVLMKLPKSEFAHLVSSGENSTPLINIGSGEEVTIAELARLIAEIVGYRGHIRFDADKPDGTPRKLLDSSMMRALGWIPSIPLHQGLVRTLDTLGSPA